MNIKLLATSLAATALIGCGGSSSSPTPTETPTPTPEVTPTPTPEVTPTPTPTPTPSTEPATNLAALITDSLSTDTGELRYALGGDGPLLSGSLSLTFLKEDSTINQEGGSVDAFITLFNEDTNNAGAILDLRVKDSKFEVRDQTFAIEIPTTPNLTQDVVVTWAAEDETTPPLVTITIDGVDVTTDAYTAQANALGGVTHIAFRIASEADITMNGGFFVDDVVIYSDTEGTSEVFSDNFDDNYVLGFSLAPDDDDEDTAATTPYNGNTVDAVVSELDVE